MLFGRQCEEITLSLSVGIAACESCKRLGADCYGSGRGRRTWHTTRQDRRVDELAVLGRYAGPRPADSNGHGRSRVETSWAVGSVVDYVVEQHMLMLRG